MPLLERLGRSVSRHGLDSVRLDKSVLNRLALRVAKVKQARRPAAEIGASDVRLCGALLPASLWALKSGLYALTLRMAKVNQANVSGCEGLFAWSRVRHSTLQKNGRLPT